jgi:hypothetical protein
VLSISTMERPLGSAGQKHGKVTVLICSSTEPPSIGSTSTYLRADTRGEAGRVGEEEMNRIMVWE